MRFCRLVGVVMGCAILLGACGQAATSSPPSPAQIAAADAAAARVHVPEGDWLRFDYDAQRNGVGPPATGINARDVAALRLRTVRLPGTVD